MATWEPHQATVLDVIKKLGLELEIIFNKGAVMILPSGINKATGLAAALAEYHRVHPIAPDTLRALLPNVASDVRTWVTASSATPSGMSNAPART